MIKSYKQLMKLYNVDTYRACATSAMRDARNGMKILKKISKETGIDIEILNGSEEAKILYNIGTLRLLSGAVAPDVITTMRADLEAYSQQYPDIVIVGSGGNINKLSRIFHETAKKSKHNILPVSNLQQIHDEMKPMTINERIAHYGLKADRADVIIPAAEIFLTVAQALKCKEIHVPNISLADCIIDGLYKKFT